MHTDRFGRCLIIDVYTDCRSFTLVCTYGPNLDDPAFYGDISRFIETFDWGGDFNFVFNLAALGRSS